MSNGLLSAAIIQRDGTGQAQRQMPALDPGFIPLEERSLADWIAFAQQYAKELHFFDEHNQPAGNWEAFLSDIDINSDNNISELLRYIENPDAVASDSPIAGALSRPHVALFITFLQLLGYIKEQINEFTKKHLDFYYYDILGLTRKGPLPDEANIIVQLVDDVKAFFVKKGTQLSAGQDSLGKDQIYVTEKDTLISQAQIQQIKTFYTGKKTTTLQQVKEANKDERLMNMMRLALGDPNPGDPLPYHKGEEVNLTVLQAINDHLSDADNQAYIKDKLFFVRADDFAYIMNNYATPAADWERIMNLLKAAFIVKKTPPDEVHATSTATSTKDTLSVAANSLLDKLVLTKWTNAYAIADARASAFASDNGGNTTLLFNTFGKGHSEQERTGAKPVAIGLAIASPQLLLQEGKRTITITLSFENSGLIDNLPADAISPTQDNPDFPFSFFMSTGKDWFQIKEPTTKDTATGKRVTLQYQNSVADSTGEVYDDAVHDDKNQLIKRARSGTKFSNADIGKYFVLNTGKIYRVADYIDDDTVKVIEKGTVSNQNKETRKYNKNEVYTAEMQVILSLNETDPPLSAPAFPDNTITIQSDYPVISMILNQNTPDSKTLTNYQQFKNLELHNIHVAVTAAGLKTLTLQNDDAVLNYKKPFEPFGFIPEAGNHFYFAHPEICSKPINQLTMHFEWMNVPANFLDYYAGYEQKPSNNSFTADFKCIDNKIEIDLNENVSLFESVNVVEPGKNTDAGTPHAASVSINNLPPQSITQEEEVLNWKRYFSLELNTPDFQHKVYPQLLTKQAYDTSTKIGLALQKKEDYTPPAPLNSPYTPKLKSFTVDYSASFDFNVDTTNAGDAAFHINAFGYSSVIQTTDSDGKTTMQMYFLPQYEYEGELYIGISNLDAPQNLSLFFQLAEGSADPDLEKPPVSWSYLSNNNWISLQGTNLVFDSTNSLLNTGIIELAIPANASSTNTLLGENLYWLRAAVAANTDAIPDTVAIYTQGISAVFTDTDNAPEHYLHLLQPGSIKETAADVPEIKKITQPYSSSKGKPAEEDNRFYIRVSERLRHKGRALTMWDYEHLVLEQFPEIYKVKCVPANDLGAADVIVIPDIKGKLPFNPFEPKAPSNVIYRIQQYLQQRVPAWASITVKNPSYTQVKVRIAVKIKEGYSENFFVAKLEEELIRYLAPWAYDEGADIYLDTRLDADVIVNFVAERFYIEYASDIYLFTSTNGNDFLEATRINGENYVQATNPGDILVSAGAHVIDLIRKYQEDTYKGIGYMKIGLDFKIA